MLRIEEEGKGIQKVAKYIFIYTGIDAVTYRYNICVLIKLEIKKQMNKKGIKRDKKQTK